MAAAGDLTLESRSRPKPPGRLPACVVLAGPTAAGKTEIAMALADRFDVRLISVDSAQVYRHMNVGTAKPDPTMLERYPHALIDIRDPEQVYSAAEFVRDASSAVQDAKRDGKLPVLVGGTMMYFNALRYGLDKLPESDPAVRERLASEAEQEGWAAMHDRLASVDPEAAGKIRPSDPQRIQRALEIHALTGRPPSALWRGRGGDRLPDSLMLVVTPADRGNLHRRIEQRWGEILDSGLIEETRALVARPGLEVDSPVLRAVGYRQVVGHLRGEYDRDELVNRGAAATRRLAKRQLTALRQWTGGRWHDPLNPASIDRIIKSVGRIAVRP